MNSLYERFEERHLGPNEQSCNAMLQTLGAKNLDEFIGKVVPQSIRLTHPLALAPEVDEVTVLAELHAMAKKNKVFKSYIGMGYSDTITPPVILRNILENPGWYTQYTPYQSEISQGRLEALLNFQTMISDLTGLPIANASLLDEATACAEAMGMCLGIKGDKIESPIFFASDRCHPQTLAVLQTRAEPLGIKLVVGDYRTFTPTADVIGGLVSYPDTYGAVEDFTSFSEKLKAAGSLFVVSADLLSLIILKEPALFGADICVGSAQRFGVPLGFGGPHAAFMATKDDYKRKMPGRLVGVSKDADGRLAIRLTLQTREQHIRREKATSNICTAQVLLAIMASMYAVYHGPKGLKKIAERVHGFTATLASELKKLGLSLPHQDFFDTVYFSTSKEISEKIRTLAESAQINFRYFSDGAIGISLDEKTTLKNITEIISIFATALGQKGPTTLISAETVIPALFKRTSETLPQSVFRSHHSETAMLRYIHRLQSKDLSLTTSMIPLGSCTMKLNATTEMIPVTWKEFGNMHPFAPATQTLGYQELFTNLSAALAEITGFKGVSLQPNAGSQGEYAGLLVIHQYHLKRREGHRRVCLIPSSAHGTNPASAAMVGMKVVVVACDKNGNIDLQDLKIKSEQYSKELSCLMVTYPSTHGVFEESIRDICKLIHQHGGQVYMDGANMNAQVGLCRPGDIGADVCHLNLHKTFCIPHGGGGPGMGPIAVAAHLVDYLPTHPVVATGGKDGIGAVSAAPWGSASILPISYIYIRMMGSAGLKRATEVAILNANYMARRLDPYFPVLYKGSNGFVAHECIVDLRPLKATSGIEVEDVAKRLMDYGFHAPTVSFPVPGTLMIEPTESESREELDRFCEAMILIRAEIDKVAKGEWSRTDNPLKNAPHPAETLLSSEWSRSYSRELAAYPAPWLKVHKYWPPVSRVDNVYGDRNVVCVCPSIESYEA